MSKIGDDMKLKLIKLLDWFDDKILDHRFYWICDKISKSTWWGEKVDIELTDNEFMMLALEAHRLDITFNELCVKLLADYMEENKA